MTNEQLKSFIAIVEQGSFRKAAESIFKTQAAVSASIKSLETEYDVQLFDRKNYRPVLTDAGHMFLHHAKLTMAQFERLDKIGRQLTKRIEPKFTIVVSLAFHLSPLLSAIKNVVDHFPDTQFKVLTESLNGVVERIDMEDADIAFGPDIGLSDDHEKFPISSVTFINVAAPNYFDKGSKILSSEEANAYSQIVVRDSAQKNERSSYSTVSDRESWTVNDFYTKKELVLAGLGWGSLPEHLIETEIQSGQLVPVDVSGIPVRNTGTLYMFRNREHHKGPVASKLWDDLKAMYT